MGTLRQSHRSVLQAVSHQIELDQNVVELSRTLKDAFAFIDDASELPSRARLLETRIIRLLQTTSDCCMCLQEYTKDGFIGMFYSFNEYCPTDVNYREDVYAK